MMQSQLAECQGLAGATMFSDVPFRRDLKPSDMERMRVPERYWSSSFDLLSEDGGDGSIRSMVGKYIKNMSEMWRAGGGLILYGDNGAGKSSASVVIAKEYRRRGRTVLFMEAADLKRMVIENEHFDEDATYWDRAKNVDVLVLDDFGKGIIDSKGFGSSLFDELVRSRNAHKLVTIITSNASPDTWQEELELKRSTVHTLRECVIPVLVEGRNQREDSGLRLRELLAN